MKNWQALNIFASLVLKYAYNFLLQNFQIIILAIFATRMHLHLWRADRRIRASDGLMRIPPSDISSAGRPVRCLVFPPRFLGVIYGVKSVRCEATVVGVLGAVCECMDIELDETPLVGIFRQTRSIVF
ncbi:hypothetical protein AZE42_11837, partial [Rhizopogon vesiculosus]